MKHETKRMFSLVLAVLMLIGCAVTVSAEEDTVVYYYVDCGDADPTTVNDGDSLGLYNSVTDRFYGKDEKTGKTWGVVDESVDTEGQAEYNDKRVTTKWTWVDTPGDGADKGASNRFCHDMKENGLDRVITYKFELPDNGEYTVEVGFANPWWISIPADVYLNGTKAGTCEATETPVTAKASAVDGFLTVEAKSELDTINIAYIIIKGAPLSDDGDDNGNGGETSGVGTDSGNPGGEAGGQDTPSDKPNAPQTGFATLAMAVMALGTGAYVISKRRR